MNSNMFAAAPAPLAARSLGRDVKSTALEKALTFCFTIAFIWFFVSVSYRGDEAGDEGYARIIQGALGFGCCAMLLVTGLANKLSLQFRQFSILVILTAVVLYALRDMAILKNASIFWIPLAPLIFANRPQVQRLKVAAESLWFVVMAFTLLDMASNMQGGIFNALFGDSLKSIFSERTWTGIFLGAYALWYFDAFLHEKKGRTLFLTKASISALLALLTTSFAVVLGLGTVLAVRSFRKRPLFASFLLVITFLAAFMVSSSLYPNASALDAKLGNRGTAVSDEINLPRTATDFLAGFIAPPEAGLDYQYMPGVPDIGVNSFSLPFFLLDDFGLIGILLFISLLAAARRAGNLGWSMIFMLIVMLVHPVHLQPQFMVLMIVLSIGGSRAAAAHSYARHDSLPPNRAAAAP